MTFLFLLSAFMTTMTYAGKGSDWDYNHVKEDWIKWKLDETSKLLGDGWSVAIVSKGLYDHWDNCQVWTETLDFPKFLGAPTIGSEEVTVFAGKRDAGRPCGLTHCGDGGWVNWGHAGYWHEDPTNNGCVRLWV